MKLTELSSDYIATTNVSTDLLSQLQGPPNYNETLRQLNWRYDYFDRDDQGLHESFYPLDEKGPSGFLLERTRTQDEVAVLDFGAGTGNQLVSLLDRGFYPYHDAVELERVSATALDDVDYSRLSERWKTRYAFVLGAAECDAPLDINYRVADLDAPALPRKSFDLIYSFDALSRMNEPYTAVHGMFRALKPGGAMYVNAGAGSNKNPLLPTLSRLDDAGAKVTSHAHNYNLRHWPEGRGDMVSYKISKPTEL